MSAPRPRYYTEQKLKAIINLTSGSGVAFATAWIRLLASTPVSLPPLLSRRLIWVSFEVQEFLSVPLRSPLLGRIRPLSLFGRPGVDWQNREGSEQGQDS